VGYIKRAIRAYRRGKQLPVDYAFEKPQFQPWDQQYVIRGWITGNTEKKVEAMRLVHRKRVQDKFFLYR
jgi:hypothetical protein